MTSVLLGGSMFSVYGLVVNNVASAGNNRRWGSTAVYQLANEIDTVESYRLAWDPQREEDF